MARSILYCIGCLCLCLVSACGEETESAPAAPPPVVDRCADRTDGALITVVVNHSAMRFWSTNDAFIDHAHELLRSRDEQAAMFASLHDGTDCDTQWTWHVGAGDMEWADITTEGCDGRPFDVEHDKNQWLTVVRRYCPWRTRVVDVDDRRPGRASLEGETASAADGVRTLVCRIERPNVTARWTEYAGCALRAGDSVTVTAGGCVQTGGIGRTWKRFVDPLGPGADHQYFGTLRLPGMAADGIPIRDALSRTLAVVADGVLAIGYVDDRYEDNGYERPDVGEPPQCEGAPTAWVEVTATRRASAIDTVPSEPSAGASDTH